MLIKRISIKTKNGSNQEVESVVNELGSDSSMEDGSVRRFCRIGSNKAVEADV